jgi:GNAT superfamily N-acetyltransferase
MGNRCLLAVEDGRLAGYLAWWEIDGFRGSGRRGAYVPEWAHGALQGRRAAIYRALYRAASAEWAVDGCTVHAITLLAHDQEAREAWFWNGFGLAVVDGARALTPLEPAPASSLTVRLATPADAEALSMLDAEHVGHYAAAPVFMAQPSIDSPAAFGEFVQRPKNSVWLALDGRVAAGFMRFSGYDFDAVAALQCDSAAFCNGAYVRRDYRGRGAGAAMLQAAITHYSGLNLRGLFTNFESFNPEAASFWPRYFGLVCLSLMRVPEVLPAIRRSD